MEVTQGTETSKYLKEEKEKSISQVAASEREPVQTNLLGSWGCGQPYMWWKDSSRIVWNNEPKMVKVQ